MVTVLKISIFLFAFAVSIIGNLSISYIVIRTRRLWTYTNIMMVNYSAVTILSVISTLLQFISDFSYNSTWPFGEFLCKITHSTFIVAVIVSAFSIILMCYARFCAFCTPLQAQPNRRQAVYCIIVIWITGISYMLPYTI
ncbi:uncharacterized protein TRIADDRAFT_29844, partial [Trichoplax adhaerens]